MTDVLCIGFDREVLSEYGGRLDAEGVRAFQMFKVEYDFELQIEALRPVFSEIVPAVENDRLRPVFQSLIESDEEFAARRTEYQKNLPEIMMKMIALVSPMYRMKNPAFREEVEHRLVVPVLHASDKDLEYRAASDRLVPFRTINLERQKKAIVSVTVGPKNITTSDVVRGFLRHMNYPEVEVKRSEATYR
ncbi:MULTISPECIES: hypothetical protein [Rhizobium]|uniref:hypothetical protein n=1 Tax=Rhizobium TaxID=379 RepID=UPI00103CF5C2|nr:hypothetical protein [Rhizobium leguminosarum]TBZ99373.1 hypothetical protein E0H57_28200 [Rhizobium leguminosarum bv. viciae]UFW76715.1 hypothetical protein RlegSU303_15760 [Rhizobium leguminosarum bv. viciae]